VYSYGNCWLPEHFDNDFCEIESVRNYQARLGTSQKYPLPKLMTSLHQFFLCILVPTSGLDFLKTWHLFHLFHLERNTKMSCSLTNTLVGLSFVFSFHFSFSLFIVPLLSTEPFTLPSAHPTLPEHTHAFHFVRFYVSLMLCFVTNFLPMSKLLHFFHIIFLLHLKPLQFNADICQ